MCSWRKSCSASLCRDGERLCVSGARSTVQEKVLTDNAQCKQWKGDLGALLRVRSRSMIQGPLTITVKPHPGDIISHTLHSPAWQCWTHHGQVCLATGTGKGGCHIMLLPRRVGDTQDLHVGERENKEVTKGQGLVCTGGIATG